MKVKVAFLAAVLVLIGISVPKAQTDGLLCFAGGYLFNEMTSQETATVSSGNVVYQLANASQRVMDPLAVRVSGTEVRLNQGSATTDLGRTLKSIFVRSLREMHEPEDYVILRITRVLVGEETAEFWFEYIEKEMVLTLDELQASLYNP